MDHNTLFYTFSTLAQVIAAIIAVTTVFVFAKGNDYKAKMMREMGNVVKGFDALIGDGKDTFQNPFFWLGAIFSTPQTTNAQLDNWRKQATSAERHGVMAEMRGIFTDHQARPELGERITTACKNGLINYRLWVRLFRLFASLFTAGVVLISVDIILIGLTSQQSVSQAPWLACALLWSTVWLTVIFFTAMSVFIWWTLLDAS